MKIPANVRFTGFCAGVIGDLFFDFVMRMKDSWRQVFRIEIRRSLSQTVFIGIAVTRPFWDLIFNTLEYC